MAVGDICIVRVSNVLRGEWRLAKVTCCYPDTHYKVRNVELLVKPSQGGTGPYVPTAPIHIKRHVGSIVVLVPVEDQEYKDEDVDEHGELNHNARFGRECKAKPESCLYFK